MAGTYGYQLTIPESVSTVTATNSVALGTRTIEGGCEYVYVYNAASHTAAVGYGMIQSLMSAFSVTVSSAIGDICFGVVKNTALTGNYYGWLCTRGRCAIQMTNSATGNHTAATGEPVYMEANGSFGSVTTGATGSTWAAKACGHVLETIATNSAGAAYFWCRG